MGLIGRIAQEALRALGIGAAFGVGTELVGLGDGGPGFGLSGGRGLFAGGGTNGRRRPRRRKALTQDDVRLALTIASAISKKAAETFIAQRVRAS